MFKVSTLFFRREGYKLARIFLSYTSKDWEIAKGISQGLRSFKHEIVVEPEGIPPGENWREFLFDSLMESDGLVVIFKKYC